MSVRRTVSVLALLVLAGCGGAKVGPSTDGAAEGAPVDPVMEQRLAVPQPKLPPPVDKPVRGHGAVFARYFIAGSLEYAMRSGFTVDFRREFTFNCERCRAVWKRIDHEYKQGHHIEMSPVFVDAIRVRRGPVTEDPGVYERNYWLVDVRYHVDELAVRDADGEIETATDLGFSDRMVVSYDKFDEQWYIQFWKSSASDPGAPILGKPASA
jgi:hypothetical protein